jgi:DNA-binding response OmpR family regulator
VSTPVALVVEDQPEFQLMLRTVLEGEGFTVHVSRTGEPAEGLVRELAPALVVLDISLPDMDGVEVCRRLRTFSDVYVVMVSSHHEEIDKVMAFSVGADDYVTKPFGKRELAMRFRAMGRRPRAVPVPDGREFGPLQVDPAAREVRVDGALVDLTRTEYGLLDALTTQPRRVLSRQELREIVWGESQYGDDHIVDVHIANLRRKLGHADAATSTIRTVRGVGYRFDPA